MVGPLYGRLKDPLCFWGAIRNLIVFPTEIWFLVLASFRSDGTKRAAVISRQQSPGLQRVPLLGTLSGGRRGCNTNTPPPLDDKAQSWLKHGFIKPLLTVLTVRLHKRPHLSTDLFVECVHGGVSSQASEITGFHDLACMFPSSSNCAVPFEHACEAQHTPTLQEESMPVLR